MKKILIILLLLIFNVNINAQDIQFTASVDKNVVALNQSLTLTVQITSGNMNIPGNPQLPSLDGLTVVSGPNTSTSISFVNGSVSSSKSYSFVVVPTK